MRPLVHDDDPVGQRHRLDLVVGDVDRGDGEIALQMLQLRPHHGAQLGVEVGQRLVHQEQPRRAHDGAGERDALALAAGEFGGAPLEQVRQARPARRRLRTRSRAPAAATPRTFRG